MKVSTVLLALVELAAVRAISIAHFPSSDSHANNALQQRQEEHFNFSVTGVQGTPYPRLEIRTLEQNSDLFNLYLLGLERFQATDQEDMLSYFQVAGIHGRPFFEWDGVRPVEGGEGMGYCVHTTNLFPPWHRPYLALFEQILWEHIQDIAAEFPEGEDKEKYVQDAETFRIPYWDWAALRGTENALPDCMTTATVNVTRPTGPTTINNPLYSYYFDPYNSTLFTDRTRLYYTNFSDTKRWPTTGQSDAQSQNSFALQDLDATRFDQASRLYTLFWDVHDYHNFSHQDSRSRGENIETIHGGPHVSLGGWGWQNGHMTDVPFSAFDPAFFLHHAMIDRCFALWQALNPEEYVTMEVQSQGTFSIKQGSEMGPDSPLPPFHKSASGDFWTSSDARDLNVFGYTYPELKGNYSLENLRSAINYLYDPRRDEDSNNNLPAPVRRQDRPTYGRPDYWEYKAEVQVSKFSLGGSFMVYVFCGTTPVNGTAWDDSPMLVGKTTFFAAGAGTVQAPGSPEVLAKGTVGLTRHLERRTASGGLASLNPPAVEPFLQLNLQWGIKKTCNTIIPPSQVPGLLVKVTSLRVRPGQSDSEFPTRVSEEAILENATCGKAGGYQSQPY